MAVKRKRVVKKQPVKRGGRKSEKTSYDSIKQAAGALGYDASFLKKLKEAGAPGFRGSRIFWEETKAWLDDNPDILEALSSPDPTSKEDWQIEKLKEEVYEKRIKNAQLRGDLIHKGIVKSFLVKLAEDAKQAQQRSRPSIASKVQGLTGPEVIAILEKHDRKLMELFAREVDIPKSEMAEFGLE